MGNYTNMEVYLAHFAKEIEQMESALLYASSNPNYNKQFLQKKYEQLSRLSNIHNGIEAEYQKVGLIEPLAHRVSNLLNKDPELGIILIKYQIRPNNRNYGIINYYPCELC
jgi:hypothetical protein